MAHLNSQGRERFITKRMLVETRQGYIYQGKDLATRQPCVIVEALREFLEERKRVMQPAKSADSISGTHIAQHRRHCPRAICILALPFRRREGPRRV